jgi:hypothetical protein
LLSLDNVNAELPALVNDPMDRLLKQVIQH